MTFHRQRRVSERLRATPRKRPIGWLGICLGSLAASLAQAEATETEQAVAVVERLHADLLEVMKDAESLGFEGRYRRLEGALDGSFDIAFMARHSVGRHWKKLPADQQERLAQAFRRFMIASYAGRFDSYASQSFETLGSEPSARGTLIVHTRVVEPGADDVELGYRLRSLPSPGGTAASWRIIDVFYDGTISQLALRRSEYSSVLERDGFEALLAALEDRVVELAAAEDES